MREPEFDDFKTAARDIARRMPEMTPEQRKELVEILTEDFCVCCGGAAPCSCWNDE